MSAIRRATLSDAAMLAELGARTFIEAFGADNDPADTASHVASTYGAAHQARELADPRTVYFVAEEKDVAAGFAMLHAAELGDLPACIPRDAPIELARIYVAKEWLGRGTGDALMRHCIEHARSAGHRTLWLGVWDRNLRAQRFYQRWELRPVGQHVFQVGSDPQNDLLMSRPL